MPKSSRTESVFTTLLDLVGVALLAGFAWFVWAPLPLLVVGLALLAVSYRATIDRKAREL